jgi:hypothetical protein
MKFTVIPLLASFTILTPSALACLESLGAVSTSGNLQFARTIDNGLTTCDSNWGWRIDQDNHISLNCLSGYIYAVTKDGSLAWYRNPVSGSTFRKVLEMDLGTVFKEKYQSADMEE